MQRSACSHHLATSRIPADDLKVMKNLHTALKSGGHLLIDLNGKEVIARNFRDREWWRNDDGTLVLQERKIRSGWDWMDSRWILVSEGGKTWEGTISSRPYSGVELKELLRHAGFSGNLAGAAYDARAERLIAVATK